MVGRAIDPTYVDKDLLQQNYDQLFGSAKPPWTPVPEVVIVDNGDDWKWIYLNGVYFDGGHNTNWQKLFEQFGVVYKKRFVDPEWLDNNVMPKELKDLPDFK